MVTILGKSGSSRKKKNKTKNPLLGKQGKAARATQKSELQHLHCVDLKAIAQKSADELHNA